jgi:hypothetical protein
MADGPAPPAPPPSQEVRKSSCSPSVFIKTMRIDVIDALVALLRARGIMVRLSLMLDRARVFVLGGRVIITLATVVHTDPRHH